MSIKKQPPDTPAVQVNIQLGNTADANKINKQVFDVSGERLGNRKIDGVGVNPLAPYVHKNFHHFDYALDACFAIYQTVFTEINHLDMMIFHQLIEEYLAGQGMTGDGIRKRADKKNSHHKCGL
jgi:hypothetical protein